MRKSIIFIFLCLSILIRQNDAVSSGSSATTLSGIGYQTAIFCPVIMCSGFLATSKAVVTTATCINTLTPDQVTVFMGSPKYFDGGIEKPVSTIRMHPLFDKITFDYNIAIIGLSEALSATEMSAYGITTIPIATALPPTNVYALTSAFGATDPDLTLPDNLQRTFLLVYSLTNCQTYKKNRITNTMFCVGDPKGKRDLCPGDQGAPLVYNNAVVGIYNWGCSCGLSDPNPSSPVFTSLPTLRTWIINNQNTV